MLIGADRMAHVTRQAAGRGGGLAALAGGWKGSEDFVRALATLRRSSARRPVSLDG